MTDREKQSPEKRSGSRATGAAIAVVAALAGGAAVPPASAAGEAVQAAPSEADQGRDALAIRPGPITGSVLLPDGRTPQAGVPVVLRDADGGLIVETRTDEAGRFEVSDRAPGAYTLQIGSAHGRVVLEEGAQVEQMLLLLPAEIAQAVTPAEAGADEPTSRFLFWDVPPGWAVTGYTGLGVAAAGGIVAGAMAGSGGSGSSGGVEAEPPISPSEP